MGLPRIEVNSRVNWSIKSHKKRTEIESVQVYYPPASEIVANGAWWPNGQTWPYARASRMVCSANRTRLSRPALERGVLAWCALRTCDVTGTLQHKSVYKIIPPFNIWGIKHSLRDQLTQHPDRVCMPRVLGCCRITAWSFATEKRLISLRRPSIAWQIT